MNKQQKELKKLQDKKSNNIKYILLGLFFALSKEELINNINGLSEEIYKNIKELRKESQKIADKYSEEKHSFKDTARNLIITTASYNLITRIINKIEFNTQEGLSYVNSVKKSIEESESNIKRIMITESTQSYNKKIIVNNKDIEGYYIWNSSLDRRCCNTCSSNDGKTALDEEDLIHKCGHYPAHPRCRCIIDFIKS